MYFIIVVIVILYEPLIIQDLISETKRQFNSTVLLWSKVLLSNIVYYLAAEQVQVFTKYLLPELIALWYTNKLHHERIKCQGRRYGVCIGHLEEFGRMIGDIVNCTTQ